MSSSSGPPRQELTLCQGFNCQQFGAGRLLALLQQLLAEQGLSETVVVKEAFCLDRCAEGCVLKCGTTLCLRLDSRNLRQKFTQEILPRLQSPPE